MGQARRERVATRAAALAQLREVYDGIPEIDCQGLCAISCGPIGCSTLESVILGNQGVRLPRIHDALALVRKVGAYTCPALEHDRCTVYADRPLICRLWGVVETMPCMFGCQPARWLTEAEGFELLAKVQHLE